MISLSIKTLPEAASVAVLATLIVVAVEFKSADNMVLPTVVKAPFRVVVYNGPGEPPQPPAPQPKPMVNTSPPVEI
jgi:hypothetical protein